MVSHAAPGLGSPDSKPKLLPRRPLAEPKLSSAPRAPTTRKNLYFHFKPQNKEGWDPDGDPDCGQERAGLWAWPDLVRPEVVAQLCSLRTSLAPWMQPSLLSEQWKGWQGWQSLAASLSCYWAVRAWFSELACRLPASASGVESPRAPGRHKTPCQRGCAPDRFAGKHAGWGSHWSPWRRRGAGCAPLGPGRKDRARLWEQGQPLP